MGYTHNEKKILCLSEIQIELGVLYFYLLNWIALLKRSVGSVVSFVS